MKVKLLNPSSRIGRNIIALSNRLRLHILEDNTRERPDTLIIVGNGTPDDKVTAILCHHLNGNNVTWLVKPGSSGLASLQSLDSYVQQTRVKKYMFLVDQEEKSVDKCFQEAQDRLASLGINRSSATKKDEKVVEYVCERGGAKFTLIVVINGLNRIQSSRHTIEDHLLQIGGISINGNSKASWQRLGQDSQQKILTRLSDSSRVAKESLPQQYLAMELLMQTSS